MSNKSFGEIKMTIVRIEDKIEKMITELDRVLDHEEKVFTEYPFIKKYKMDIIDSIKYTDGEKPKTFVVEDIVDCFGFEGENFKIKCTLDYHVDHGFMGIPRHIISVNGGGGLEYYVWDPEMSLKQDAEKMHYNQDFAVLKEMFGKKKNNLSLKISFESYKQIHPDDLSERMVVMGGEEFLMFAKQYVQRGLAHSSILMKDYRKIRKDIKESLHDKV